MADENQDTTFLELDTQLRRLETIADPAARNVATDLVASVLQFHAAALERVLEVVDEHTDDMAAMIAVMDRDPLVRSLLLLHDLHPDSLTERVTRAINEIAPRLEKRGATVEVLGIENEAVRVRIHGGTEGGRPLGPALAEAIRSAAPDASEVIVEEGGAAPASAFVPLHAIKNVAPAESAAGVIQE